MLRPARGGSGESKGGTLWLWDVLNFQRTVVEVICEAGFEGRRKKSKRLSLFALLRSLFWIHKINHQGKDFWFSPVFNRMCFDVPEQASGGFLAEEMVSDGRPIPSIQGF